jgi:hypothetical protein
LWSCKRGDDDEEDEENAVDEIGIRRYELEDGDDDDDLGICW